jgi:AcrR family transcriptional regulator
LTSKGGRAYSIKRLNQSHGLHVAGQRHRANVSERKIREVPTSTKARILLAAEEVFARRGFAGASTREIASKAGVNISSLHYHWESKETLYAAVLRNVYGRWTDVSRDSAHEASIGRLFDHFAAYPSVPRLLLRRMLEEPDPDSGNGTDSDGFLESWTRNLGGWVRQRGSKRNVDAQLVILTLYSALLLFTADGRLHARLLGGCVADPAITRRLRGHLTELCARLLEADPKALT